MLKPLGKRVVIKQVKAEEKTQSGIFLPTQAQEAPQVAEVMAIGTEELTVKVGDRVIFPKFAGTEVKFEGDTLIIIEEEKLLAIVE